MNKRKLAKIAFRLAIARTKRKTFDFLSWLGNLLGNTYNWLWYHSEFWISKKINRRPYTFIMRDWIYPHRNEFAIIMVCWFAFLFGLAFWHHIIALALGIFTGALVAHLIWGSKWIPNEQENPPYNPDRGKRLNG